MMEFLAGFGIGTTAALIGTIAAYVWAKKNGYVPNRGGQYIQPERLDMIEEDLDTFRDLWQGLNAKINTLEAQIVKTNTALFEDRGKE